MVLTDIVKKLVRPVALSTMLLYSATPSISYAQRSQQPTSVHFLERAVPVSYQLPQAVEPHWALVNDYLNVGDQELYEKPYLNLPNLQPLPGVGPGMALVGVGILMGALGLMIFEDAEDPSRTEKERANSSYGGAIMTAGGLGAMVWGFYEMGQKD